MLNLTDVVVAAFEVDVLDGDIFAGRLVQSAVDCSEGATCDEVSVGDEASKHCKQTYSRAPPAFDSSPPLQQYEHGCASSAIASFRNPVAAMLIGSNNGRNEDGAGVARS